MYIDDFEVNQTREEFDREKTLEAGSKYDAVLDRYLEDLDNDSYGSGATLWSANHGALSENEWMAGKRKWQRKYDEAVAEKKRVRRELGLDENYYFLNQ